jgi:hypothetical protein
MSKGGGGGTNTVQKADPWAGQQPYLTSTFQEAQRLYNQGPMQFYPGQTYADPTTEQLVAEQMATQAALGGQSAVAQSTVPAIQQQLAGPAGLASNPFIAGAAQAAIRPLYSGAQGLLQQARRDATGAGQLGGTRQAILEKGVIGDYLQRAGDVTAQMYGDAYGQTLEAQSRALGLAPSIMPTLVQPAQTLAGVGATQQARQQQAINEQRARFEFGQQAPSEALTRYANIVAGSILPGTTTGYSTGGGGGIGTGGMLGGLGGYLGATSAGFAGSALGTQLGAAAGPVGMIVGATLGGLFD